MSEPIDDGGPVFPTTKFEKVSRPGEEPLWMDVKYPGISLRAWMAANEQLDSSEEFGWELLESLAGPRPSGNWSSHPLEWFDWSNRWQAKVRVARADAIIAVLKGKEAR